MSITSTLSFLKRRQGKANARRSLVAPLAPGVCSTNVGLPRGSLSFSMNVNFEYGSSLFVVVVVASSCVVAARGRAGPREGRDEERTEGAATTAVEVDARRATAAFDRCVDAGALFALAVAGGRARAAALSPRLATTARVVEGGIVAIRESEKNRTEQSKLRALIA